MNIPAFSEMSIRNFTLKLPAESIIGRLLAGPMRPGRITWIGVRPARRAPMMARRSATLRAGKGIEGDRYHSMRDGPRQVTLLAEEDLAAIAGFCGIPVGPELLRRNLVTHGINVLALRDRRFRVGDAVLEGTGECAPCSLIEEALGPGGYNAVRGHGGITARIVEDGEVALGDEIERIDGQ